MRILLTGASGYIGKRLLPVLVEEGHEVICCVRDKSRYDAGPAYRDKVSVVEIDFLEKINTTAAPLKIDAAFYLIHSMSSSITNFEELESVSAKNFADYINKTECRQVIYLSGISNKEHLSRHLESRKNVEAVLADCKAPLTVLRAGIIVGSGSASFEIIRDLVEKLPVMITPKWLNTKAQPIAVRDVISCLKGVLLRPECMGNVFDIGGPEIITYKEMLLGYAEVRKLRRLIITLPVMTPRLSSYWLYFVTSTSYKLAVNLVDSMKVEVVCRDNDLMTVLNLKPLSYRTAVELAFQKIEQNLVMSSWKDSLITSSSDRSLSVHAEVPEFGVFKDERIFKIESDPERILDNIWAIGGERGWYYADFLWGVRGFLDKVVGGVGLRRGRTNPDRISAGDALDFWRVLIADRENKRLLLYAEMKLPGEAWLEFRIIRKEDIYYLKQAATFRANGLLGRLYWYSVLPFHSFVFEGMARRIIEYNKSKAE